MNVTKPFTTVSRYVSIQTERLPAIVWMASATIKRRIDAHKVITIPKIFINSSFGIYYAHCPY